MNQLIILNKNNMEDSKNDTNELEESVARRDDPYAEFHKLECRIKDLEDALRDIQLIDDLDPIIKEFIQNTLERNNIKRMIYNRQTIKYI